MHVESMWTSLLYHLGRFGTDLPKLRSGTTSVLVTLLVFVVLWTPVYSDIATPRTMVPHGAARKIYPAGRCHR